MSDSSKSSSKNGTPTRGIVRELETAPLPPELAAAEEQPVVRLRNGTSQIPAESVAAEEQPAVRLRNGTSQVPAEPAAAEEQQVRLRNGTSPMPQELADAEEQPVVRLRNGTKVVNGEQQVSNGHAAIQRGLEVLAEQEMDQNLEEIKKLDTQLDHFHKYLDSFEKKNNELTDRLQSMLKNQKEERIKRRSSFMQREEEYKAEQNSFENQVSNILTRCAQSRRTSVPVFGPAVEQSLDQQRALRQGAHGGPSSTKDEKMDTQ